MDKIPDLYQVKWRKAGSRKWNFGIVDRYGEEAEKAWASSHAILVDGAILPVANWVYYDKDEIVEIPLSSEWDKKTQTMKDEYSQHTHKEYVKAQEKSKKATGLTGKMFSMGVADGAAYYVVVKENKKTVKIEWRGFCPDRYFDHFLGWGGTFQKDRIERMIRAEEGLSTLFAKTREEEITA